MKPQPQYIRRRWLEKPSRQGPFLAFHMRKPHCVFCSRTSHDSTQGTCVCIPHAHPRDGSKTRRYFSPDVQETKGTLGIWGRLCQPCYLAPLAKYLAVPDPCTEKVHLSPHPVPSQV